MTEQADSQDRPLASEIPAVGEWLSDARRAKRWSVAQLAEASGVSAPQIYNIERGTSKNPQERTRHRLEKALEREFRKDTVDAAELAESIEGIGSLTDFDPYDASDLPEVSGVYVFYDVSDRPVYVGRATKRTIALRVPEHEEKFWFKRPIVDHAAYVQIDDETLCNQVERVLIRFLKSNAVLNKQNTDR